MTTAYVSGPMHGVPDHNKPLFAEVTETLRNSTAFDRVINPHEEFSDDVSRPWEEYMAYDLDQIRECDTLVLIPGWDDPNAAGVRVELVYAIAQGVEVCEFVDDDSDVMLIWWDEFDRREAVRTLITGGKVDKGHPSAPAQSNILDEANRLVSGARQADYDHPKDNFGRIVRLWNALLAEKLAAPITEEEHALMMMMVKSARLLHSPDHRDSVVDIAGYARTYELVLERRREDAQQLEFAYNQYAQNLLGALDD